MNKITKSSLISLAVAAAMVAAPQAAFAHKTKKAHHHHVVHHVNPKTHKIHHHVVTHAGHVEHAPSYASAAEVAALRAELAKVRAESAKKTEVQAVADKAAAADAAVEAKLVQHEDNTTSKNTLFFRGGYASMTHPRNNELLTGGNPGVGGALVSTVADHNQGNGWYIGAGIDHRLTNDLWGMTDLVALDGELMFQYMNFGSSTNTFVSTYNAGPGGILNPGSVGIMKNQITQFTLAASPKLKFNTGTIFTPWIIPFGLSMNVISPPSSGITVLNPGLMLGVGGEAEIIPKALVAGVDFRYNFTGGDLSYQGTTATGQKFMKGVSTDGLTAGGYLGFKF